MIQAERNAITTFKLQTGGCNTIIIMQLIILSIESPEAREFMSELYLSYHRLMYSEISKVLSDSWAVEDVLQTALIKLIGKHDNEIGEDLQIKASSVRMNMTRARNKLKTLISAIE